MILYSRAVRPYICSLEHQVDTRFLFYSTNTLQHIIHHTHVRLVDRQSVLIIKAQIQLLPLLQHSSFIGFDRDTEAEISRLEAREGYRSNHHGECNEREFP